MQQVIADAMAAGAAGFATSSSPTHSGDRGRPVPSRVADLAELRSLLEPLRDAHKGVAALLPGEKVTHADVYELQRATGRPLTWTALLTVKGYPWHEKIMEANTKARRRGHRGVAAGVVPAAHVPDEPARAVHVQHAVDVPGVDGPARRRAAGGVPRSGVARTGVGGDAGPRAARCPSTSMRSPSRSRRRTRSSSTARSPTSPAERGVTPLDAMLDISIDENLETRFTSVLANNDPEAIAWLLPQDTVLLGLADSGAHVTQLCDACFATDLLGNWVRDKEVMPLEHAIHKLTGEPAAVFGLHDRGTLEVGKAADVVVFDFDTVGPGPLRRIRDFPADGERLVADRPEGISHVVVNGTVIREGGTPVDGRLAARPGKLLRSS